MMLHVALVRGINVAGHNAVPMAGLRELCAGLGWGDVRTYIQSGNVVFRAPARKVAAALEGQLEKGIEGMFGVRASVVVRPAAAWAAYVEGCPLADACGREPNLVMLCLSKTAPKGDAVEALRARAGEGERVEWGGTGGRRTGPGADAIWVHYGGSGRVARSKLTPAVLERAAGSPVTARNWRTVVKLGEMMVVV